MPARDLPFRPNLDQYRKQAKDLLKYWKASDPQTTRKLADAQHSLARDHGFDTWKQFVDEIGKRTGLPDKAAIWKSAEDALVAGDDATLARLLRDHEEMFRAEQPRSSWFGGLTPDYKNGDARTIIAREHFFAGWDEFADFAKRRKDVSSSLALFERAADAVVLGDAALLERELKRHSGLIQARSVRTHHSTLLHYVGANGVEGWRQRTPGNAVQIAEILLNAGAEVDATADMYKGGCTTVDLIATSIHPENAGLTTQLIDLFVARGARLDTVGAGNAHSLVNTCLANSRPQAAKYVAVRGAPLDLEGAAGVGNLALVKSFFSADGSLKPPATVVQRRDGFSWACAYGHTDVVEYLLARGVPVDAPLSSYGQGHTALHIAAYEAQADVIDLLLRHGAAADPIDTTWNTTPLLWALTAWTRKPSSEAGRYREVVARLIRAGAAVPREVLESDRVRAEPAMLAVLSDTKPAR